MNRPVARASEPASYAPRITPQAAAVLRLAAQHLRVKLNGPGARRALVRGFRRR